MHDKIIKSIAKKILTPYGIFQKGTSRVWLKDCHYFVINIEFQPFSGRKGTCLNVGVSFLWEKSIGLNDTLSYDFGHRTDLQFIEYINDEQFSQEFEKMAFYALECVKEYEQFLNFDYAKQCLIGYTKERKFWGNYNLAMLCFLKGNFDEGLTYFHHFLEIAKQDIYRDGVHYIEWIDVFYQHCINHLLPQCNNQENAQKMVIEMIKKRRLFFASKSSYKKLSPHFSEQRIFADKMTNLL